MDDLNGDGEIVHHCILKKHVTMQAKGEDSVTQKLQEARRSNITSQIYETSTKCPKKLIKAMITI